MSTETLKPAQRRPRVRVGEKRSIYLEWQIGALTTGLAKELNCTFAHALNRLIRFLLASHSHSPYTLARAIEEHEARQGAGSRS